MFRVSCIQLRSNNNIHSNLDKTSKLIIKAVKQKTDFIITPEVSSHFSLNKKELLKNCTSKQNDIYLNGIKKLAKMYKKWISEFLHFCKYVQNTYLEMPFTSMPS